MWALWSSCGHPDLAAVVVVQHMCWDPAGVVVVQHMCWCTALQLCHTHGMEAKCSQKHSSKVRSCEVSKQAWNIASEVAHKKNAHYNKHVNQTCAWLCASSDFFDVPLICTEESFAQDMPRIHIHTLKVTSTTCSMCVLNAKLLNCRIHSA